MSKDSPLPGRAWLAFLFFSFFFLYQISLALSPVRFAQLWFFGADSQEQLFVHPLAHWNSTKHPLFTFLATLLYHFATSVYSWLPEPLNVNFALAFPVALFGAASVALGYGLFRRLGSEHEVALLFAALYGLGTSTWIFASFPDTYMVTSFATIIFFWALISARDKTTWIAAANAGAALASPQQVFLAIVPVYLFLRSEAFRFSVRRTIKYGFVLLLLFVLPYEIWLMKSNVFDHRPDTALRYFNVYASLGHLREPASYGTILLNFFVFSLAGPISRPWTYRLPFTTFDEWFQPFWIGVAALYAVFAAVSLVGLRRASSETKRLVEGTLAFIFFQAGFFLYFNPLEAFLYSGPLLFPWLLVLHEGFRQTAGRLRRGLLVVVVLAVAAGNFQVISVINSLGSVPQQVRVRIGSASRKR